MSIWGTGFVAGEDDDDNFDGSVVSYINGWSNHYPGRFVKAEGEYKFGFARDVTEETPASISTAWMPAWCVPSDSERDEDWEVTHDVDTHLGPWLRLDVMMCAVSIWAGVEIGNQDVHSVCLNEHAVKALRDDLNAWLEREKVYPKEDG